MFSALRRETSLLRSVCILLAVASTSGYQFADRAALKTALVEWCADSGAATNTYGDINTWDVRTRTCTHSPCYYYTIAHD
jgi:hypothetical protein